MSTNRFYDFFPTPHFLEMPYVGIDISSYAVRMMEITKGKNGLRIGRHAERLLKTEVNFNENLSDNAELKKVLIDLQKEFSLKFVKVSIPEEKSYLFKTEVEKGSEDEMRHAIEFRLEENVPISLEESVFDFYKIKNNRNEEKVSVTVSVVARDVLQNFIDLLSAAGLTPISFLIEEQATSRAVIKDGDKQTYLIVNIWKTKTSLSIINQEAVWFTSTLHIGSMDFTNAIMKQFNLSFDEAEKMKREQGFTKSDNSDLLAILINTASALRDEIGRLYMYWQTHGVSENTGIEGIQKIILSGRDSSINGFKEYLEGSMRAKVEMANVWCNIVSLNEYIPDISFTDSLNYGSAVGLALPKK